MINSTQCKAARTLLKWTRADLAAAAQVSLKVVKNFEAEQAKANFATMQILQTALEKAGVEFLERHGVRLKSQ
jgi:ribosome-binding protein aMBF1 (putative translation factor)